MIEGGVSSSAAAEERARRNASSHTFSVDIKDIRSYTYNDPKKGVIGVDFLGFYDEG